MRLYLRRDNSMVHSRFIVKSSDGKDKFIVTGKSSDAIGKMAISSTQGEVLIKIRMMLSGFISSFVISNGYERFTLVITNSSKAMKVQLHGIDWTLRPLCNLQTFEVYDSEGNLIMSQKADSYSMNGYYTLDIFSPYRELFCIAVAICADSLNYSDSVVPATT